MLEYLGPLDFIMYYNEKRFVYENFTDPIVSESKIVNQQVDKSNPNFIHHEL